MARAGPVFISKRASALVGPIAAKIRKMVRQMIAIAIRLTIVRMSLSQGSCTTGLSSSFIRVSPSSVAPHRSAAAGRRDRAQDDASIATAQAACHAPASEAVTAVTGLTHFFLDAARPGPIAGAGLLGLIL